MKWKCFFVTLVALYVGYQVYCLYIHHSHLKNDDVALFYQRSIPFISSDSIGFSTNKNDENWTYYYLSFCLAPKVIVVDSNHFFAYHIYIQEKSMLSDDYWYGYETIYADSNDMQRLQVFKKLSP